MYINKFNFEYYKKKHYSNVNLMLNSHEIVCVFVCRNYFHLKSASKFHKQLNSNTLN